MKQKDIFLFLIPGFILVLAWVVFSIYHNSVTSTISETLSKNISPINPTFDKKTIDDIKNRNLVQPLYQLNNIVSIPPNSSKSAGNQASSGGNLK